MDENRLEDTDETGSYFFGEEVRGGSEKPAREPGRSAQGLREQAGASGFSLAEGQRVMLEGQVRAYEVRSEQQPSRDGSGSQSSQSVTVVVFRLDTYDAAGNRTASPQVQLRGETITGQLRDGDEVRVSGVARGGVIHTDTVTDTRTGAQFRAGPARGSHLRKRVQIAFLIAFLVVVAGFSISAYLSTHRTVIAVMPNVVGQDTVSASTLLDKAGLNSGNALEEDVPSSDANFGKVLRTDPKAGTRVPATSVIRLYVGNGSVGSTSASPPASSTPAATAVVPDLTGESPVSSVTLLENAGFSPGTAINEEVPSSTADFGKVLRTDPKAGTRVPAASVIRLYVGDGSAGTAPASTSPTSTSPISTSPASKGASAAAAVMPNLVGQEIVSTMPLLENAGFDPGKVIQQQVPSSYADFGIVMRTDPAAGTRIPASSVIRLYVGDGQASSAPGTPTPTTSPGTPTGTAGP